MKTDEEILATVRLMRTAQRRFYAGEKGLLGQCRALEREVDRDLEARGAPTLFDVGPERKGAYS